MRLGEWWLGLALCLSVGGCEAARCGSGNKVRCSRGCPSTAGVLAVACASVEAARTALTLALSLALPTRSSLSLSLGRLGVYKTYKLVFAAGAIVVDGPMIAPPTYRDPRSFLFGSGPSPRASLSRLRPAFFRSETSFRVAIL